MCGVREVDQDAHEDGARPLAGLEPLLQRREVLLEHLLCLPLDHRPGEPGDAAQVGLADDAQPRAFACRLERVVDRQLTGPTRTDGEAAVRLAMVTSIG